MFWLYFLVLALVVLNHNITPLMGDWGEYLNNAVRISQAQIPYRDFWLLFPPGEVYFPALVWNYLGQSVNTVLLFDVFVGLLLVFLSNKVIFELTGNRRLSQFLGLLIFVNTMRHWYSVLAVAALWIWVKRKNIRQGELWAGMCLGICAYFRLYEAVGICLAFLVAFGVKKEFKSSLKFLIGFGVMLLSQLVWFGKDVGVLVNQLVLQSLVHSNQWFLPYFIGVMVMVEHWVNTPLGVKWFWYAAGSICQAAIYLFPLIVFGVGGLNLPKIKNKNDFQVTVLLLVWSAGLFVRALVRGDVGHLTHSLLPLLILTGVLWVSVKGKWLKRGLAAAIMLICFSVIELMMISTANIYRARYPLKTRHGIILMVDEKRRNVMRNLIEVIESKTKLGEEIFYTDWEASALYALTDRRNPTYYDSMIDLLAAPKPEKEERICYDLFQNPPKLIIHNPEGGIFDGGKFYSFANLTPKLNKCIEDNYQREERVDQYWIYTKPTKKVF